MERWNENYPYNKEVEEAWDSDLFRMARENTHGLAWNCLHDLAWRHDIEWTDDDWFYEAYNRINAALNDVPRLEELNIFLEDKEIDMIDDATDYELLDTVENSATWDDFTIACLHEIVKRHDLGWGALNKHDDTEDADEMFDRVKIELKKITK